MVQLAEKDFFQYVKIYKVSKLIIFKDAQI